MEDIRLVMEYCLIFIILTLIKNFIPGIKLNHLDNFLVLNI